MGRSPGTAQRYGLAVLIIAAMLVVRVVMAPLWETTAPFALFMFGTVFAAWWAGTGPAILAGASGLAARIYFDLGARDDGVLEITWEEAVRLALYAGFVCGAAVVIDRMKRDRRALEQAIAGAQTELEERRRLEDGLRAAQRQAEQANRLKDEFLAMVSHELRTPLNAILGWVSLLRAGSLNPQRADAALEAVHRNARLQAQLVQDLLDVARSLTGQLHLDRPAPVALVPLAVDAAEGLRAVADQKGVRLVVEVPPESGNVWGDAGRLRQIVTHLLHNALKFTPAGGDVRLAVTTRGGHLELAVTDTGAGIDAEFLPRVFERFTQADTGTTRQHGGLGLGLAVTRELVELHRGAILVDSDGPGQGSRVLVRLPLHTGTGDPDDAAPPGGPEAAPVRAPDAPAPLGFSEET